MSDTFSSLYNQLVVDDDYVKDAATYIQGQGERFEAFLEEYISILEDAVANGIKAGGTSQAFQAYVDTAKKLQKEVGAITEAASATCNQYITDIDEADEFLY